MLASRRLDAWVPVALALGSVAVYLPLIGTPLSGDDFNSLETPARYATLHSTLFRPVMTALLCLGRAAYSTRPWEYHLTAVLLHGAIALIVYTLLHQLSGSRLAAIATVVWALSPRSIEAVIWVSAAANEVPYVLCVLTAIFVWLRWGDWKGTPWVVALLYGTALLAKQSAIVLPALLLVVEGYRSCGGWPTSTQWVALMRDRFLKLRPILATFALYAMFEFVTLHLAYRTPGHAAYGLVRPVELLHYLVEYPALAIVPFLSQSWILPVRHEVLMVIPVGLLFSRWMRARDLRTVGAVWFGIAALPTMLFAGFGPSDEYFYLPALGIALALAAELHALAPGWPRVLVGGALGFAVTGSFAFTVARWRADARGFEAMTASILSAAERDPQAVLSVAGAPQTGRVMPEFMNALPAMVEMLDPTWAGTVIEVGADGFTVTPT